MKTIIISLSLLIATNLLADELAWVDEQVQAIKPERLGMNSRSVSILKDPFIFLAKNRGEETNEKTVSSKIKPNKKSKSKPRTVKTTSKVLTLGAIMNNSVMISGTWYKLGDKINGYKVSEINYNSVLLIKNKKKLLLSTKSTHKNLKFQR